MSYQFGFDQNVKDYIDVKVAGASGVLALSGAPASATAATDTVTSNNTNVDVTTAAVAATDTVTSDQTNITALDTVTVNGKVYTFQAIAAVEGDVLKAGSADASLTNLANAINNSGGTPGTDYVVAAANPDVTSSAVAAHAITLTAKAAGTAGNSLTLARSSTHLSVGNANFTGGLAALTANTVTVNGKVYTFVTTPASEGDVKKGASADASLTNLANAINGTGGTPGTDYHVAAANPDVTSGTVSSHAIVLTSVVKSAAANALTLAKSAATLSLTGANFAGGLTATPGALNQFGVYSGTLYICTVANTTWKTVASLS